MVPAPMGERVVRCPHCSAPVSPARFARNATCSYCGATVLVDPDSVSVRRFRDAFDRWGQEVADGAEPVVRLGGVRWALLQPLGTGTHSTVWLAQSLRWPSERVVLKLVHPGEHTAAHQRSFEQLEALVRSAPRGLEHFGRLIPMPRFAATVEGEHRSGERAFAFRWEPGFVHSLDVAQRRHPSGIGPEQATWLLRRLLELADFLHAAQLIHGGISPAHVLIEDNEHGARLVGFSALRARKNALESEEEVRMILRCVRAALEGDGATTGGDSRSALLAAMAKAEKAGGSAMALHQQLGLLARELFGPPSFHPIDLGTHR